MIELTSCLNRFECPVESLLYLSSDWKGFEINYNTDLIVPFDPQFCIEDIKAYISTLLEAF